MVGGGNNVAGCRDAIALDLRHLPDGDLVWAHVADVEQHGPLACEGLSVQALPSQHALLAWGGYNGHYHNQLHCYKPGGSADCWYASAVMQGGMQCTLSRGPGRGYKGYYHIWQQQLKPGGPASNKRSAHALIEGWHA